MKKLLRAHKRIEKDFIFKSFKHARLAKSGTKRYGFENIVGVGISEKVTNSTFTGEQSITVFVVKKVNKKDVSKEALVPEKVLGVPTDVLEIGEIRARANVGRYRPAPGGVSIGHFQITAGTLGCLVTKNNQTYILSNNHVLANSNNANLNDPILQPGPVDGGQEATDTIGRLIEFAQIAYDGTPNSIDAALATSGSPLVTAQNKSIGTISSTPAEAALFQVVKKCGRTTEFTRGIVTSTNATVKVGYDNNTAIFQNQIIISGIPFFGSFSQPGDSGSLIVTEFGNNPVGLLFAGSDSTTIANPIQDVLSAFGVTILS